MSAMSIMRMLPEGDREYLARVAALRNGETTVQGATNRIPGTQQLNRHLKSVMMAWVPHVFDEDERDGIRRECFRYLVIAHEIENVQRDIWPRRLPPEVEAQKNFAWSNYQLRYFRLFRVNDLPTEVLNNILRLVIWDSSKTPVQTRLNITWVCKRWREIALNDATLWTAIWFRPSGSRLERAFAWLDRAKKAPVDVRLDCGGVFIPGLEDQELQGTIAAPELRDMLIRILEKRESIRMLIMTLDDWDSALTVLELLATIGRLGMPKLERFELHRGGTRNETRHSLIWPNPIAHPFLGGIEPPILSYLSLNGVPIEWNRSVLENLTTFDIRRLPNSYMPDLRRFREILSSCPRLVKLSLDGAGPRFDSISGDMEPIDLPLLRTLVVAEFTRSYAIFIFSLFTARNVNDLTLMNFCGDDYTVLFDMLTGMFPNVQLLTAYSLQFEVEGSPVMVRWLESMPKLTYMRVANQASHFYGLFFRDDLALPVVAPSLQVIDCQAIDTTELLVKWAQNRGEIGAPLKKIYVSENLGKKLSDEEVQTLLKICPLSLLPRGATTPEEDILQRA
ncbi:F-box domain-containing protein [Mycena chlorophos]|uniref:F-box domain-containing protein n=1 Tax=Mycena chlorophos TaxID=658473 RepID=A0A8H6WDQ2_MYCCL|nr:F-box domain-containing protein [Mycena chlorophos]